MAIVSNTSNETQIGHDFKMGKNFHANGSAASSLHGNITHYVQICNNAQLVQTAVATNLTCSTVRQRLLLNILGMNLGRILL